MLINELFDCKQIVLNGFTRSPGASAVFNCSSPVELAVVSNLAQFALQNWLRDDV